MLKDVKSNEEMATALIVSSVLDLAGTLENSSIGSTATRGVASNPA